MSDKPMMSDSEIKIIDDILQLHQPESCLEWGSGGSTLYFPRWTFIKSWLSVEHNGHYVTHLKDKTNPSTNVVWADKEWYIDCVKLNGRKYDFILIDGETRDKCLFIAHEIIKPGGVILLHDSGRSEYQEFIKLYDHSVLIDGEIPDKGGFAHRGITMFWGPDEV